MIMVMLILQAKQLCTWVNEESWVMMKTCFPDAKRIKTFPKYNLYKECTYVQKEVNKIEGNINFPLDNEPIFHHRIFMKNL